MPKIKKYKGKVVYNTTYYRSVHKEIMKTKKQLLEHMKKKEDASINSSAQQQVSTHASIKASSSSPERDIKVDCNLQSSSTGANIATDADSGDVGYLQSDELSFMEQLKAWALKNKITHEALNELLVFLRKSHSYLPKNSRTLLKTPLNVNVEPMASGHYWYNGLKTCLASCREISQNPPQNLILSFNIDGLPLYNSSKAEFWPILFKIDNKTGINPMIIAIYCGENKPNLQSFLTPFVEELLEILQNGVEINGCKINIKIRCFICDSPARSYVKGTVNFNHYHGCTKCICIGEYYRDGRHMSYPRIDLPARTNDSFRKRTDPDHHKDDSPLERLPIDMIADFPVADSLHLIDLGMTKKCLTTWTHGTYNFRTKFSQNDINSISKLLIECNRRMPIEIHRAVRPLDSLKFWKGTEFRTFLLYVGPIVLKDFLPDDVYEHFLMLSCVVRICSCSAYLKYLEIADKILRDYIETFIIIYGIDSVSSNVHNLCHLIEDVKRFGALPSFSGYPFENHLYQIKKLLRHGNKPLPQVAKRIQEITTAQFQYEPKTKYPLIKNNKEVYISKEFRLSTKENDKWFLTKNYEVFQIININREDGTLRFLGSRIKKKYDFFTRPFKSSYINIYSVFSTELYRPLEYASLTDVKCKLIMLKYKNEFVFIPLIHTIYEIE